MRANFADQRILAGTTALLSWQAVDGDGSPVDPGTVTVGITDADEAVVVAPGAATSGTGTNPRTYSLSATLNDSLSLLTAAWDSTTASGSTVVETVGGFYFSVEEARGLDDGLGDTTNYPTSSILVARREVEDTFEAIKGFAMVPRYRRATVDGTGRRNLVVPDSHIRTLRSVKVYTDRVNFTELSADSLQQVTFDDDSAVLHYPTGWPCGTGNITLEYEHGLDGFPASGKRHAVTYLRHLLNQNRSGIPDRAERYQAVEGGTYFLSMPGPTKTGIPEVDAWLARPITDDWFMGVA